MSCQLDECLKIGSQTWQCVICSPPQSAKLWYNLVKQWVNLALINPLKTIALLCCGRKRGAKNPKHFAASRTSISEMGLLLLDICSTPKKSKENYQASQRNGTCQVDLFKNENILWPLWVSTSGYPCVPTTEIWLVTRAASCSWGASFHREGL